MKESLEVLNEFLKEIDADNFYAITIWESSINLQGYKNVKYKMPDYKFDLDVEEDWFETIIQFKNKTVVIILTN